MICSGRVHTGIATETLNESARIEGRGHKVKHNLHKRLGKLEVVSAAARRAREASANKSDLEATTARLRELLRLHGIEQQPHESFANTLARTGDQRYRVGSSLEVGIIGGRLLNVYGAGINRALPQGDSGHRDRNSGGQSGSAGSVPGACGLLDRAAPSRRSA